MAILGRFDLPLRALPLITLIVVPFKSASADTIQILNTSSAPIVLSDLIVWSSPNRMGIKTVILKPGDSSDDITLQPLNTVTFGGPFTFIQSYAVSETLTLNGKVVETVSDVAKIKIATQIVIAFLSDSAGDPLYLDIDSTDYTPPPAEGTSLMFSNGATAEDPDWTLYTSFDESSGVFSGLYSGEATVVSTALSADVDPVPEPAAWLLVCSGLAVWKCLEMTCGVRVSR